MITLFIDTQSISEAYFMDESETKALMDYTVKEITARFAQQWESEAIRTLKSSRQEYITNLNVIDEGPGKGAVVLTGKLPNMIESGSPSFDEKEGLLNGPNSKPTKNGGRINFVPFRFGAPNSLAENFNGGILPTEIHNIFKQRNENEPLQPYDLPQQYREPQKKQVQLPQSQSFVEYQHRKSIFEGIAKHTDKVTGQNSYMSFRAVSTNSKPESWIFPGLEARNIADKVLESFDVPVEVGRILDEYF